MVELQHYPHIEHGYAATIHKAQGVTVDRSYVLASPYLDRHATYVGMTRHRHSADIFWSQESFKNEKALLSTLSRERAKDWSLDYGQEPFRAQSDFDRASAQQPFENTVDIAILKALAGQQVHFDQMYQETLRGLAEQLGKPVSSQWQAGGEPGIYCRNVVIGGAIFCLFEQAAGFKVLPERDSHGHWPGRASTIALTKEGEDYSFVANALDRPGKELGALEHRQELSHQKELGKTLEPDLEMEL
jgi:hypothetical protein